jgi:hypothetical protein
MRTIAIASVWLLVAVPCFSQSCKTKFTVVSKDSLDNVSQDLPAKDVEWFQKKIAKKYPDVCYVAYSPGAPIVFLIDQVAATKVIDGTEDSRPIFYLHLQSATSGHMVVIHNFSAQDCPICHPQHEVIENAVKWIHDGGLTDSTQGMAQ